MSVLGVVNANIVLVNVEIAKVEVDVQPVLKHSL